MTAQVTVSQGTGAATGTVTFLEGTAVLGTGTLSGAGLATFSTSTLAAGDHTITATFDGDPSDAVSSSSPVLVTINAPAHSPTTTRLTGSSSFPLIGQSVTFTAIVAAAGQILPTGHIAFTVDGAAQNPVALSAVNGQDVATLTLDALTLGDHVVTAAYDGDASFAASSSSPVDVAVSKPFLASTTTVLTGLPTNAKVGQLVTFTVIVSAQDSSAGPSSLDDDSVRFTIDGATGTDVLLHRVAGVDVAMVTTSTLSVGTHTVTASFAGDAKFTPSDSNSVSVTIATPAATPTATALSTSTDSAQAGEPVVLTASVTATGGSLPTGSVTFTLDGVAQTPSGLSVINGRDMATLTLNSLAKGSHLVSAAYGGSAAFGASASDMASVLVTAPAVAADGPLVTSLQRFGFHSQPTVLVLTFSEALDPTAAGNAANYRILLLGPHGKSGHSIAVTRVAYDSAAQTVTLRPSHALNVHKRFELIVSGTSAHPITDLALHALDGATTGKAGSDYVGMVDWGALAGPSLAGKKYARFWAKWLQRHR